MLNEKQKTLRGDWLRVNKNSIVHYSTDLLTFDPYYVWHSALSSFVRFFRYRLVGRESDRTSLRLSDSQFSQRRRLYNVYHDSTYHIPTSVLCARQVLSACMYHVGIHTSCALNKTISAFFGTKREFHLQRVFDSSNC